MSCSGSAGAQIHPNVDSNQMSEKMKAKMKVPEGVK